MSERRTKSVTRNSEPVLPRRRTRVWVSMSGKSAGSSTRPMR